MRGIVAFIVAVMMIGLMLLAFAPVVEHIVPVVAEDPAVQDEGWGDIPGDVQTSLLDYAPRIFLFGMVAWAVIWYLRKELLVGGA